MSKPNGTDWLKVALSIREPLQFVAFAFGLSIAVLLAAMSNDTVITTLDRAGLIWLVGIIACVLTSVLLLGALVVWRQPDRSRPGSGRDAESRR